MFISWPFSPRKTRPDGSAAGAAEAAGRADNGNFAGGENSTRADGMGSAGAHPAGGENSTLADSTDGAARPGEHAPDASRPAISVEALNVDRSGVRVLHDLSFSVAAGERITITGSNGSGKTTLLSTILGLLHPTSGSVHVDGMRVGSRKWRRARHIVGYVSQHAVHTDFPISASEVVAIGVSGGAGKGPRGGAGKGPRGASAVSPGRREKRRRMLEAMEMAGCAHFAGAAYATLSGGQRQRVSIARCLCQNPRVLLLDEPTASLDPEGKETLLSLADRLSQTLDITVLMVSHESSHFQRPGWRRLALEAGRIGADASGSAPWK